MTGNRNFVFCSYQSINSLINQLPPQTFILHSRLNVKRTHYIRLTKEPKHSRQMKIQFYLRFYTKFGESIFVKGNVEALGHNNPEEAFPLQYVSNEFWQGSIEV